MYIHKNHLKHIYACDRFYSLDMQVMALKKLHTSNKRQERCPIENQVHYFQLAVAIEAYISHSFTK